MARMRNPTCRRLGWLVALLGAAWLTATHAEERTASPGGGAAGLDPAEAIEPPDVDTGQYGTSSGITHSDMDQAEEGSGSGQTQGDDMIQTPAAGSDDGPAYEVQPPEREAEPEQQALPDDPLGAQDEGRRESGEPQSSNEQ
ncbi:hypothetical protein F0A17_16450 [Billgrantia pellis]|uniref:Uncharacterized protein n=1 Tax=Billgrantia pellis TaxID=2606936 RepID=A0A7V7FXK8_9GAMM|nr:hypothetical protein [Halomonas pellis]KAA0010802.1 hypothetical protein F0A17_16450 [Halomonas pellis]